MPKLRDLKKSGAITDSLRNKVLSGEWNPNQPISTDRELANSFGVSRSTIVKSLKRLQDEGYICGKQGKGRFVSEAMAIRQKTWNIGVVISSMSQLSHPVVAQRLLGIQNGLQNSEYHLKLFAMNENSKRVISVKNVFNPAEVDGVVLFSQPLLLEEIKELATKTHVVWVDPPIPHPLIGAVREDLLGAAFTVGKHLVGLGHTNIALITADEQKFPAIEKQQDGVRLAMLELIEEQRGAYHILRGDDFTAEDGEKLALKFLRLSPRPTAIICGSDEIALGVFNTLKAKGIRVPEDVSLVGWNNSDVEKQISVPLTAVGVDYEKLGRRSVEILLSKIAKPDKPFESETIGLDLIVRKSTGRPAGS